MFDKVNVTDDRGTMSAEIDGKQVSCSEGDTVAAVVILHGQQPYRRSILSTRSGVWPTSFETSRARPSARACYSWSSP